MDALENNTFARFVYKVERNASRAFKTVSFKDYIASEEKNTLDYRKQTSFLNQKSTLKHSLGPAYYSVQQGTLYLTPTNLPEVNHLDLENHVFDMGLYYESVKKVPEVMVNESIENHSLIERHPNKHVNLESIAENFIAIYYGDIKDFLQKEYEHYAMVSLSKEYDAKVFTRVINSHLSKKRDSQSLPKLTALLLILCTSSKDNVLITDIVRKVFLYLHSKDFQSSLADSTIEKMFNCVRLSSRGRYYGPDRYWILSERFVEHTFMRGDVKRMKRLLMHKCPSAFMAEFAIEKYLLPDAELWPRKKLEECQSDNLHSYYSLKYYIYISCLLSSFISVSRAKESDITECIRLFWKSIPTPIIPLNDMQEFFLNLNQNFHWGALWPALQYFPKEFDTSVYQPRSLQHLSRFVIMQNLNSPRSIVSLEIPKQMHSYLHLEFDEFLE